MKSAALRPSIRSPHEIDLCRFASYLGYTSQKPVSELLISSHVASSIDPVKREAVRNCLDDDFFVSCSIPSLDLFSSKETEPMVSTYCNDATENDQQSNSRIDGKEDYNKVKDESDRVGSSINLAKVKVAENPNLIAKDVDGVEVIKTDRDITCSGSEIKHGSSVECSDDKPKENFLDFNSEATKNLCRPFVLSRVNLHEAPIKMLRGMSFSFSKLIDSRVKTWVDGMLSKSFRADDKREERQILLSLMTISDTISLVKASNSLRTLPAIIPNFNQQERHEEQVVMLPLAFNSGLYFEMSGEESMAKVQCPGAITGTFNSQTRKLVKVELDLDSTVLLASMIEQANNVALQMISVAAAQAFNNPTKVSSFKEACDPEITSRLPRNGSYAADQYSGFSMAQVPTLKRSMHLSPSSSNVSKAKRIESKLGLVRNNTSHFNIDNRESTKKDVVNATFDVKPPRVLPSALNLSRNRSAVTWTDLSDTENIERAAKKTKNAGWGSAILKNKGSQSCSSMKRTISSGASTIVRSLKSSKNATFADFERVGNKFKNSGISSLSFIRQSSSGLSVSSSSSSLQLRRPECTNRSFIDLKHPDSSGKSNANAAFDIASPSGNEKFKQNRFLSIGVGLKKFN